MLVGGNKGRGGEGGELYPEGDLHFASLKPEITLLLSSWRLICSIKISYCGYCLEAEPFIPVYSNVRDPLTLMLRC